MSYDLGVLVGRAQEIVANLKKCKKEREKIEELARILHEIDGLIAQLLTYQYGPGSTQTTPGSTPDTATSAF